MDQIERLLRGVDTIYPNQQEFVEAIKSGKKLRVYQGFDPTGAQLHIGHMAGLRKLRHFQDTGHEVIFLIGDFTAMIGDPTGKDTTRLPLTHEQVLENAKLYKEQAERILRFEGPNPIQIKYNSDWLAKMSAVEFAQLTHHLSIQQIIERDMFQKRLANKMNIAMSEFLYPVMQAYDSIAMDIDLEIGGTDQMFNMMLGRELMHKIKRKNKFVMTLPLLTDSEGRKIGKTEGNVIGLDDKPEDLYWKVMNLGDDIITKAMVYLTDIPISEISKIEKDLEDGKNPINYKKRLAYEIVKSLNSEESAKAAQEEFERVLQNKEESENKKVIYGKENVPLSQVLAENNIAVSVSEAKRIIEQAGVKINGEKIDNPFLNTKTINSGATIQVGKRDFYKLIKK